MYGLYGVLRESREGKFFEILFFFSQFLLVINTDLGDECYRLSNGVSKVSIEQVVNTLHIFN